MFPISITLQNHFATTINTSTNGQAYLLFENAWERGQQSADMASLYLKLRSSYGMSNSKQIEQFLKSLPKDSLNNPNVEIIVVRYATELKGVAFEYLLGRKNNPRCQFALNRIIKEHHEQAAAKKSEKLLAQTVEVAGQASLSPEAAALRQTQLKMEYYLKTNRPDRFHAEAAAYFPTQLLPLLSSEQDTARLQEYAFALETIAWQYTEFVKNEKHLAEMASWLKKCPQQVLSSACLRYRSKIEQLVAAK